MSPRGAGKKHESAAPSTRRPKGRLRRRLGCAAILLLAAFLPLAIWVVVLDRQIRTTLEGRIWTLPSKVYSSPLRIRVGERIAPSRLRGHLDLGNYVGVQGPPSSPGQYRLTQGRLEVNLREFAFPGSPWPRRRLRIDLRAQRVVSIVEQGSGRALAAAELEPQPIASFFGASREERTPLPLGAYPQHLIKAVLAAEDQRFYAHHGLDPMGILRAIYENVRSGDVVQGGSTITQQTVKNLYLTGQRTLGRKLKEAVMAVILEARYPKDRILEVYLNEVYLGQRGGASVCGIGEAARFYFGKEGRDLDLAESALLAGMIRAPALCNPFSHPDRALERRSVVLRQMLELGWATKSDVDRAAASKVAVARGGAGKLGARYFVEAIREELAREGSERELGGAGLKILSTLDLVMQRQAEQAIERGLSKLEQDRPALARRKATEPLEGCLIAMRPATGEILALVGGRDYSRSQFDRARQARRQPGSLFKPFVYATGFERGQESGAAFTPATILEDEPLTMTLGGREWSPKNYDEVFRGPVTARQALENSLNVPTVRAAVMIGIEAVAELAEAAGMGRDLKAYPSLALGAQEVTPLEAATAYALFANGGMRPDPHAVAAVADGEGRLLERRRARLSKILSPEAAYLTVDLMRGVVDRGTAAAVREHGILGDLAGKTGTTNDKRDAWFVGFRPDLLVLVWVGFDDGAETRLTGAQGALPIWEAFMRGIGEDDSDLQFERPPGVIVAAVDPATGGLATGRCRDVVDELFIGGKLPEECPEHAEGGFARFWRRLFGKDRDQHPDGRDGSYDHD